MKGAMLIIEDEAVLAKNIATYFRRAGFLPQTANSAEEGLACMDAFRPDVVVLDYQLPGMNGLELLAHLRASDPLLPVIILTGQGTANLAVRAMTLGAVDFLSKPVALDRLLALVEKVTADAKSNNALRYYLSRDRHRSGLDKILGESGPMQAVKAAARRRLADEEGAGATSSPVLIAGETGTGKALLARALHHEGPRRSQSFVGMNLSATLPEMQVLELFGCEPGGMPGVGERQRGFVDAAEGGTLFLDEIGAACPELQDALFRLIEGRVFRRIGGERDLPADVRIIAACTGVMKQAVDDGRFRPDLYQLLCRDMIVMPPLRERGDDVVLLARAFLVQSAVRYRKSGLQISEEAQRRLVRHDWPGNARELQGLIEQTVLRARGTDVGADLISLLPPAAQ
jgi:DNA-binding NtrC family response regulator